MDEIRATGHPSPIKNVRQLLVVVVLAFLLPIALSVTVAQFFIRGSDLSNSPAMSDAEVAKRMQPAGTVALSDAGAPKIEPGGAAAAAERSGEQIVQAQCMKCHQTGEGGAPKIGERAAWIPRVKKGLDPVVRAAIGGHDSMPARGGRADLTDTEFRNAIVYMFQAGGAQPAFAPAAVPATTAPAAAAKPDAAKGKAVYEAACGVCHAAGVAGAPKAGDKAAWAPRMAGGIEALYTSSLKGKNAMPPKGGNLSLADADVKAAVDYMVGLAK